MNKSTNNRKNYGTAYYAMAFLAAFFFEFYWIWTNPYEHFMLLGIGVIMLITGYLTIDSILKAKADSDALRNEQNDMMLKAQKAIYIATKKNAKDAEASQIRNIKAMEIMMNKMISSQQALLEEKKPSDDMNSLIDQLSASNAKLAKEVQSAITVNQLVKANADLVRNVKEALSASANTSSSPADLSSYVNEAIGATPTPAPVVEPKVSMPEMKVNIPEMSVNIPEMNVDIPEMTMDIPEMSVDIPEMNVDIPEMTVDVPEMNVDIPEMTVDVPEMNVDIPEMTMDAPEMNIDIPEMDMDIPAMDMSLDEATTVPETDTFVAMENEINMAEMEASVALEDMIIPDEITPDIEEAMDSVNADDIITEPESPFTMPASDNPNKQLTEEEIAALFASL